MRNEARNELQLCDSYSRFPTILDLREETETKRRLPEAIVAGLRKARLCRTAVAEGLQGLELAAPEALAVYEALAYAEPSVGWIVWNNSLPC